MKTLVLLLLCGMAWGQLTKLTPNTQTTPVITRLPLFAERAKMVSRKNPDRTPIPFDCGMAYCTKEAPELLYSALCPADSIGQLPQLTGELKADSVVWCLFVGERP